MLKFYTRTKESQAQKSQYPEIYIFSFPSLLHHILLAPVHERSSRCWKAKKEEKLRDIDAVDCPCVRGTCVWKGQFKAKRNAEVAYNSRSEELTQRVEPPVNLIVCRNHWDTRNTIFAVTREARVKFLFSHNHSFSLEHRKNVHQSKCYDNLTHALAVNWCGSSQSWAILFWLVIFFGLGSHWNFRYWVKWDSLRIAKGFMFEVSS